jgi:Zn-finger domain-containing protein
MTSIVHHICRRQLKHLLLAIELEIRRRPSRDQYPEIWEPLTRAIDTLNLTLKLQKETQDDFKQILGWQRNHDSYLEPVFTSIALEHLKENKPRNIIKTTLLLRNGRVQISK